MFEEAGKGISKLHNDLQATANWACSPQLRSSKFHTYRKLVWHSCLKTTQWLACHSKLSMCPPVAQLQIPHPQKACMAILYAIWNVLINLNMLLHLRLPTYIGLARAICIDTHRICVWPYIICYSCQNYRTCTPYVWLWPNLHLQHTGPLGIHSVRNTHTQTHFCERCSVSQTVPGGAQTLQLWAITLQSSGRTGPTGCCRATTGDLCFLVICFTSFGENFTKQWLHRSYRVLQGNYRWSLLFSELCHRLW
jgi:hypothetical protein